MKCKCGNCQFGFNCMVEWSMQHPGSSLYTCECFKLGSGAVPEKIEISLDASK